MRRGPGSNEPSPVRRGLDRLLQDLLPHEEGDLGGVPVAHLAGDLTLTEAHDRTVIATRQFARRQLAWWKDDPRITWVDHDAPDRVERALGAVRAAVQ